MRSCNSNQRIGSHPVKRTLELSIVGFFLLLVMQLGCSSEQEANASRDCSSLEPENPYSEGTGHYAGYEWAESNDPASCGGNSTSFIEGCEEYHDQVKAYKACLEKR